MALAVRVVSTADMRSPQFSVDLNRGRVHHGGQLAASSLSEHLSVTATVHLPVCQPISQHSTPFHQSRRTANSRNAHYRSLNLVL